MSENGISTLPTKAERQIAKLELAALNRAATGRRSTYDLTQLPTVYAPGDNDTSHVIHQSHPTGLITGRPWVGGGTLPGPFTLNWYGTVSQPTPIGTYSTVNGGVTLDPGSYIDVGESLTNSTFTVTLDANLGLGWDGNRWDAVWANEAYDLGTGIHCFWNFKAIMDVGPPNGEVEFTTPDITDNVRRFYTFVVNVTTVSFYVNGSLIGNSGITEPTLPASNFYIGARHGGDGTGYNDSRGGTYYLVKVESTALTSQQVANAYTAWAATI